MLRRALILLMLVCGALWGQGASLQGTAMTTANPTGQGIVFVPIPSAAIYVCTGYYTGTACTSGTATVYSNVGLTTTVAQPLVADQYGNYGPYYLTASANYFMTVSGGAIGAAQASYNVSVACQASGACSLTNLTITNLTATSPDITPKSIESVLYADQFPGSDIGAKINAAEAAASPGAEITYACRGDEDVSTQIVITKPVTLKGCDRAGRLVPTSALTGEAMIYVAEGAGSAQFLPWGDAVGITLKDLWIEDTSERGFQTDGILMNYIKHVHFHDITIEALDGYALKLGDPNATSPDTVSESSFDNLHFFWDGDYVDQLPVLDIYTPAGAGDEDNDLYFSDSQINNSYYWAVRIGTGNSDYGPRNIWFDDFQVEGLEALPGSTLVGTIGAPYDGIEVQQAQNISLNGVQISSVGPTNAGIDIIGSATYPVENVSITNSLIGSSTCLSGTVDTNGTAVTWESGSQFNTAGFTWAGYLIGIPSETNYAISAVNSPTSITLATSAGVQTGTSYILCGGPEYGVETDHVTNLFSAGNQWLTNTGTVPWSIQQSAAGFGLLPPNGTNGYGSGSASLSGIAPVPEVGTNSFGTPLVVSGGAGTGSGPSGSIEFDLPIAGTSGSSPNLPSTVGDITETSYGPLQSSSNISERLDISRAAMGASSGFPFLELGCTETGTGPFYTGTGLPCWRVEYGGSGQYTFSTAPSGTFNTAATMTTYETVAQSTGAVSFTDGVTLNGGATLASGQTFSGGTVNATTLEQGSQAVALSGVNGLSAGTITISSAVSGSHTFTTAYTSAPTCTASESGASPTALTYGVSSSTTAVTVTLSASGSGTFTFTCSPAVN